MSVTGSPTCRLKRRGYPPEDSMHLIHVVDNNVVSEKHGQDDMLCVRMTGGSHWRLDPMVGDLSCLRESVLKLAIIAESWSRMSPNAGVAVKNTCKHAAMKEVITHDVK